MHRSFSLFVLLATALGLAALTGCGHESVASSGVAATTASPGEKPQVDASAPQEGASPVGADSAAAESLPDQEADVSGSPVAVTGHDAPALREPDGAPPRPMGQRPPADRTPRRPGEAEKITFDDLNLGMQADMVFRPFLINANERVKELEGQKVSILGFMHGGVESRKGISEFILLKNTECKYGPGGQADHLTEVRLAADQKTDYQGKAIKVEGTFKVEPFVGTDGNTWSIYVLEDAKVMR